MTFAVLHPGMRLNDVGPDRFSSSAASRSKSEATFDQLASHGIQQREPARLHRAAVARSAIRVDRVAHLDGAFLPETQQTYRQIIIRKLSSNPPRPDGRAGSISVAIPTGASAAIAITDATRASARAPHVRSAGVCSRPHSSLSRGDNGWRYNQERNRRCNDLRGLVAEVAGGGVALGC